MRVFHTSISPRVLEHLAENAREPSEDGPVTAWRPESRKFRCGGCNRVWPAGTTRCAACYPETGRTGGG